MRRYIIAIDPGKTTGYALYDTQENTFESGQLDFEDTAEFLWSWAEAHKDNLHLVSESFIITVHTAKNTQATWSIELIGIARWLSKRFCGEEVKLQQPAAAKRFSSDDRLKALEWYKPGKGHANDAARHLLLFLVSRKWWDDRLAM